MISVKVKKAPNFKKLQSNLAFGLATGMTYTVKEAQQDIQHSVTRDFTVRGPWWKQSNKFGIKISPAIKRSFIQRGRIQASVQTDADWLELHEGGGTKRRTGNQGKALLKSAPKRQMSAMPGALTIPAKGARPTVHSKVARRNKARNLKRSYAVKQGDKYLLFKRIGRKGSTRSVLMHVLQRSARIKDESTFFEPGMETIRRNLIRNIQWHQAKAFANIKVTAPPITL